jgi:hypothetical protein
MPEHQDKTPWDEKTEEEKAKSVCDELVHNQVMGNLRPVSQEKQPMPKAPSAPGPQGPQNPPKPPKPPKPNGGGGPKPPKG